MIVLFGTIPPVVFIMPKLVFGDSQGIVSPLVPHCKTQARLGLFIYLKIFNFFSR